MSKGEVDQLEAMMNNMANIDAAGTELAAEGELDDLMPEMEDFPEEIELCETSTDSEDKSDVHADYIEARSNIKWAMRANKTMLVNNARIASVTSHPKNFEAHDKMMQTQLKLAEALISLTGKLSEGKLKSRASTAPPVYEENDAIEGSSKDVTDKVHITRRPTQNALWDAITYNKENGGSMDHAQITELAHAIDAKNREAEEVQDAE